jgi:transposase
MEVVHERCCGLDVHKDSVVACLLTRGAGSERSKEVRSFGTTTDGLLKLSDWLQTARCTHVALESTGVYWKPIYNILEGQFELLLVNAQHLKAVPGRKTDVLDAEWIADLLQHGLLRGSYVPSAEQRELRELTRYRTSLVQERAREVNRVQKVLEGANIKLGSVVSDVMGVSARAILAELLAGESDPQVLANLARGSLREKRAELQQALKGTLKTHHHLMLTEQLGHIDYLDEVIARLSAEIAEQLRPFDGDIERLDAIPGVSRRTAEVLLAEMGTDMGRFPSAEHLSSWAGMCPGNNESAGKRKSGKTRKGSRWLRQALVEAAHGAAHSKGTYLGTQYAHLARRRGRKKAQIAVGHSIVVIVYHMLSRKEPYQDLGPDYLDKRHSERLERSLVGRLQRLGFQVTLTPAPAAA